MIALRLISFAGIVLLTIASQAAAQQRLFAVMKGSAGSQWVAHLMEAAIVDGRVVSVAHGASVPGLPREAAVAAGGRYVVWQHQAVDGGERLALFDRLAGQASVAGWEVWGVGVSDPTGPRLLAPIRGAIANISALGIAALPNTAGLQARALSRDGRRLYAVRLGYDPSPYHDIVVLDSMTGQVVRTVRVPGVSWRVPEVAVADDEASVWLWTETETPPVTELTIRRIDMTSGAETLSIPLPNGNSTGLQVTPRGLLLDEEGQRVAISVAYTRNGTLDRRTVTGEIRVFDSATGDEIGRTDVEGFSTVHLDRGTRSILAFSQSRTVEFSGPTWCGPPVVRVLFPDPGRAPEVSRAAPGGRECYVVAFASPPPAPQLDPPSISASGSVTLSWSNPPELTAGFVVEAGSAPGLANLASFPVAGGATLTVENVPPGSYHVRVRARNDIGLGVPSNEILVHVPAAGAAVGSIP